MQGSHLAGRHEDAGRLPQVRHRVRLQRQRLAIVPRPPHAAVVRQQAADVAALHVLLVARKRFSIPMIAKSTEHAMVIVAFATASALHRHSIRVSHVAAAESPGTATYRTMSLQKKCPCTDMTLVKACPPCQRRQAGCSPHRRRRRGAG